jgi:hypothetical protein
VNPVGGQGGKFVARPVDNGHKSYFLAQLGLQNLSQEAAMRPSLRVLSAFLLAATMGSGIFG